MGTSTSYHMLHIFVYITCTCITHNSELSACDIYYSLMFEVNMSFLFISLKKNCLYVVKNLIVVCSSKLVFTK